MNDNKVADAVTRSWVYQHLPEKAWPYAQLARWERPIGWKLLMWPCWWSFALAVGTVGKRSLYSELPFGFLADWLPPFPTLLVTLGLFTLGAMVMRGAGCTYNDLVDQDIDDKVARTRSRPLPSGRVTPTQAKLFLLAQLLVGFLILVQFNATTFWLGVASLVTVLVYPFMKRITWWPQLFLGFAFSWGALVGWTALTNSLDAPAVVMYLGCICWVIGYDTIYAHQDKEDDAIVGVKSTARLFGDNTPKALATLYGAALLLFAISFALAGAGWFAWIGLVAGALQMARQIVVLNMNDPDQCLDLFKSNSLFGWIIFGGLCLAAL